MAVLERVELVLMGGGKTDDIKNIVDYDGGIAAQHVSIELPPQRMINLLMTRQDFIISTNRDRVPQSLHVAEYNWPDIVRRHPAAAGRREDVVLLQVLFARLLLPLYRTSSRNHERPKARRHKAGHFLTAKIILR